MNEWNQIRKTSSLFYNVQLNRKFTIAYKYSCTEHQQTLINLYLFQAQLFPIVSLKSTQLNECN